MARVGRVKRNASPPNNWADCPDFRPTKMGLSPSKRSRVGQAKRSPTKTLVVERTGELMPRIQPTRTVKVTLFLLLVYVIVMLALILVRFLKHTQGLG